MGTWVWGILAAILLLIGGYVEISADNAQQQDRVAYSHAVAGNLLVYRNAAVTYATANPAASGAIDDASLVLPTWYQRITGVSNYVNGGQAWVYYVGAQGGQVSELLKQSNNNVLVGVATSGTLYNALAGATQVPIPTAIPDGAVVFAPSALNAAAGPGPGPGNCTVPASTSMSWTVAAETCTYKSGASPVTIANNAVLSATDNMTSNTGNAAFLCSAGTMATVPQPGATCIGNPCSVASTVTRSWTVAGNSCSGPAGGAATNLVPSGTSWTFTNTAVNVSGAAGFLCTNGTLSATPDGSQTCVPTAAPCVLPTPSTQTNTQTQTATQTLACAAGYTGSIKQTQPQKRTQTRTAYCPALTGAYAWNAWSAWSAWSATGPWTTTSNTCVLTPPPPVLWTMDYLINEALIGSSLPASDERWIILAVNGVGRQLEYVTYLAGTKVDRWHASCGANAATTSADLQISTHFHGQMVSCSGSTIYASSAGGAWNANITMAAGTTITWSSATATCSAVLPTITAHAEGLVVLKASNGKGQGVFQVFSSIDKALGVDLGTPTQPIHGVTSSFTAPNNAWTSGVFDNWESWCSP